MGREWSFAAARLVGVVPKISIIDTWFNRTVFGNGGISMVSRPFS